MRLISVPKNHLMLVAGGLWILAGAMVTIVGLPLELRLAPENLLLVPLAAAIFATFYRFVFSPLIRKHTLRIRARGETRLPLYAVFNPSSWAVMAVMMGGGMGLRVSHVVPDWAIAFFYSGLGLALFLCGLRFVAVYRRKDVLGSEPAGA